MGSILAAIGLTLVSGLCDAFGFVHAARAWKDDHVIAREMATALALFALGALAYVLAIRHLDRLGITSPEVQTLGWFATTVVGVAILERSFGSWSSLDKVVAVIAVLSVGWLVVRQG